LCPTATDIRVRRSQTAARRGGGIGRKGPIVIVTAMLVAILAVPPEAVPSAAAVGPRGEVVHSVSPPGEEVLDNRLVRLVFNGQTGQFEAYGLQGELMRLFQAGPAWEVNDRKVTAREAVKVATRHESFEDKIGQGEKLMV